MSWKIAIVVALFTALVTAVITAPVADRVTKQMKVSNMEGGRGYMVTERMPMRYSELSEARYEYTRVMVRYRVVKTSHTGAK